MDDGSQNPEKKKESQRRIRPRYLPPPSRRPIPPTSNTEANEKAAQQIAQRISIGQGKDKTETKASSSEVTSQPNLSSLARRLFGVPEESDKRGSDVHPSSSADIVPTLPSVTAGKDGEEVTRTEEAHVEPWDYVNSYYPTVLPWREPNSGDTELLDQEEFGEIGKHRDYDESSINTAEELGLTSENHSKKQMFLFKFPDCLPIVKQSTEANTKRLVPEDSPERSNPFEGLPEGFMGKMLVYKSGVVKMKLGDVLFDVFPGPSVKISNDVAAIDIKRRNCCCIGSSVKFVTVIPNVESLLNSASDMEVQK